MKCDLGGQLSLMNEETAPMVSEERRDSERLVLRYLYRDTAESKDFFDDVPKNRIHSLENGASGDYYEPL